MNSNYSHLYPTGILIALVLVYVTSLDVAKRFRGKLDFYTSSLKKHATEQEQSNDQTINAELQNNYRRSWWIDSKLFDLERRGIFNKEWLFVTNTSRFKKAGDYQTLEILGFSIIVIRGKDDQIRTFHNICRHRAYTVTKKAFGSSTVLGCRYHGWSYDTKGKLIKAPEFDTLPGFDKTMNGLWEVKTQVHFNMVFINFDGSNMTAPLNLDGIGAIMKSWDISKLVFVSDWKVEGGFNWKLMDSINFIFKQQNSPLWKQRLMPWAWRGSQEAKIFPTTFVCQYVQGVILLVQHAEDLEKIVQDCKDMVSLEVSDLVFRQRRLLHDQDSMSESRRSQQDMILQILKSHADEENKAGMELNPAEQKKNFSVEGRADDDFCRALEENHTFICSANSKGLLEW